MSTHKLKAPASRPGLPVTLTQGRINSQALSSKNNG
jgi:hypothetical protein